MKSPGNEVDRYSQSYSEQLSREGKLNTVGLLQRLKGRVVFWCYPKYLGQNSRNFQRKQQLFVLLYFCGYSRVTGCSHYAVMYKLQGRNEVYGIRDQR